MLKVMIAEDEGIERKALKFLCNKFFAETIEVVCEAIDGIDAVEKVRQYKPNIIFMDINMPGKDGLQAAGEIKKILANDAEFIILTAYGHFEYAKKAIKIGINDYLLKPASNDEFVEAVEKVISKINDKKLKEDQFKELEIKQKQLLPLLEKEVVMKMIFGTEKPDKDYSEYLKMLDISHENYMCLILKTHDINKLNINILNRTANRIKYYISDSFGSIYSNEMIFLLFSDEFDKLMKNNKIEKLLKELKEYALNSFSLELDLGNSPVYTDASNLHYAYEDAKNMINESKNSQQKSEVLYSYETEQELFKKILNENLDGALSVFEEIYESLINTKVKEEIIRKHLDEFLFILHRNIFEFWSEEFDTFNLAKVQKDIENITDYIKIRNYIKTLISEIIQSVSEHKKDKSVMIIEEVKSYIEFNYKNNISLDEVAEKIELSSYYLSKLFKKIEKMNFKDYVIKLRMEEAKKMLRSGKASIKEIAFDLGYSDPNYFSRAFKKYTGKSATEYSKL